MHVMRRPVTRTYGRWHPHVHLCPAGGIFRSGALTLVPLGGPAGPVGPAGATDHPYAGMDPSDSSTWTRPYAPQAGMIAWLNYDGAGTNRTQTTGGPNG